MIRRKSVPAESRENKATLAPAAPAAMQARSRNGRPQVPASACPGIVWPAIPGRHDATTMAIAHQLEHSQWWTPETLARMQRRQLGALVRHAAKSVPFYRDRLTLVETWDEDSLPRRSNIPWAGLLLPLPATTPPPPAPSGQRLQKPSSGPSTPSGETCRTSCGAPSGAPYWMTAGR